MLRKKCKSKSYIQRLLPVYFLFGQSDDKIISGKLARCSKPRHWVNPSGQLTESLILLEHL